ncbi:MAG: inorganic diphosphatase [Myxococcota bacterium]
MPEGTDPLAQLTARARVVIEVPRGGFIKRKGDGRVDFVSPLPCPYNYGSIPGVVASDGDELDALVLGPRLRAGTVIVVPVRDVVRFVDAGVEDPKVVCSAEPLTHAQRRGVERFFTVYAWFKRGLLRARGGSDPTFFDGWSGWGQPG